MQNESANIHPAAKFAEEKAFAEMRKKDKEEAHLYMEILVTTEENFKHHQGFDLSPLANADFQEENAKPTAHRVKKKTSIKEFLQEFCKPKDIDATMVRPWCMVNRQNGTTRPDQPIYDDSMTLEEAGAKYGHKNNGLRIWIENAVTKDKNGAPVFGDALVDSSSRGTKEGEKPVLLFLKYFDVDKQTLYGVGHFYATPSEKVNDLSPAILKLLNWPAGTSYRIYEVKVHQLLLRAIYC
jgi:ubiquitin carboxyl-terminal hydrolase 7